MRLPTSEFTDRPWRIHELAPDFQVQDVWALPTPGGADDFPRLLTEFTEGDPERYSSCVIRVLFQVRWTLGRLLRWDEGREGVGERVETIRDRLPEELRDGPTGPDFRPVPFTAIYRTDTEYVAEIANKTVHALIHVGWVPGDDGRHYAQMTTLVKPNGMFGRAYLLGITPFRRVLVYPIFIRKIGVNWAHQS